MAGDWEQKPGDPADKGGAPVSRLQWLLGYLERNPEATLRAGEGKLLVEEIKRLEGLAYLGEHHFPDLTYKARAEEMRAEITRLNAAHEQRVRGKWYWCFKKTGRYPIRYPRARPL